MEIWKDIEGYEGLYQVSNLGRVKSVDRVVKGRWGEQYNKEKMLKLRANHKGYLLTYLYKDGKRQIVAVHRLVAKTFIPNPDNKPEVDHINRERQDNRVENLRWATSKENSANRNNTNIDKAKRERAYRVVGINLENGKIKLFRSATIAAELLGIKSKCIGQCCRPQDKQHKTHGGYRWLYIKRYCKNVTLRSR